MKIMVIDDRPDDLEMVVSILREFKPPRSKSCEIVGYGDYRKALRFIDKNPFDVVVTDMVMGKTGRGGFEVINHLANRSSIVIVATAYASYPDCVEAIKAGAWDYLEKDTPDQRHLSTRLIASLTAALKHRTANPERGTRNPDDVWVKTNLKKLMRKYPGKLVAVVFSEVVDCDDSYAALSARLRKRFALISPVIVSIPDLRRENAL
jgi:DNA-binding NtrC family response regulator